jgi:UDP-glucose 4-epimerase
VRVVVTGGAGFIGANLCAELARRPEIDAVTAIDDLSSGSAQNLAGAGVRLVQGSVLSRSLLDRLVARADAVVHLAARNPASRSLLDPEAALVLNAAGTLSVLESCRRQGTHLVTATSAASEAVVLEYGAVYDLPVLAFRLSSVYGPLQPVDHAHAAVVPTFVDAALHGRPLEIHGTGDQTRDFTYVGTAARVLADAVIRRLTSNVPVGLAFGASVSVLELAHRISRVLGTSVEIVHKPPRPGDVHDPQVSDERLRRMFPDVKPVALDEGLQHTARWLAARTGPAEASRRTSR